eukprot:Em0004g1425a
MLRSYYGQHDNMFRTSVAGTAAGIEATAAVSFHSAYRNPQRFENRGTISRRHGSGRSSKITEEVKRIVEAQMQLDDVTTATQLRRLLAQQREGNKVKRFEWCQEYQQDNFENVIWTDESSIQLETHREGRAAERLANPLNQSLVILLQQRPKHPVKVHVWGAISVNGPAPLCMFDGIMDAPLYVKILDTTLLPFIARKFPSSHRFMAAHRFMADNDPKHTSKLAQQFLKEKHVNWWRTPAESLDLNPIENLWHELKQYMRGEVKPKNKEELINEIKAFWRTVTPQVCVKYNRHLK